MTTTTAVPWTVERKNDVALVRCPVHARDGWEQRFLLRSDAHHDSPQCDRRMEQAHLEAAAACGAGILDFGDLFDAMQGREDRRRRAEELRDEDHRSDYFDQLVDHAEQFYAPYARNWILFGRGNHEDAALTHSNTDLIQRLAARLRRHHDSPCVVNSFSGWVKFQFLVNRTERHSALLWHTHGAGGAAPVTRGVIKTNRRAVYLPDANIVVGGHTHHAWSVPIPRVRVTQAGVVYEDEALHLQIPTYKRTGHFEEKNEMPPKPIGAYWLKFTLRNSELLYDVERAR